MRYMKLGRISSTVSLVALLAAAGMSSAQAAAPVLTGVSSTISVASSAKMTPHTFENSIITDLPLPPLESGLCGQAGLDPVFSDTSAFHYRYEVRNNVVTAVADPGWEFAKSITLEQRTFLFNPAYYSCPGDTNIPNANIFITQIDAPKFGRVCDPADKQIVFPSTKDKPYYYFTQDGEVIAEEKDATTHIIQQDTIRRWPIILSTEPCEDTTPVIQPPNPVTVVPGPPTEASQVPAEASLVPAEAQVVPAAPATTVEPVAEAAPIQAAVSNAVGSTVSVPLEAQPAAATQAPAQLPEMGAEIGFWLGLAMIALSIGGALILKQAGFFARR